MPPWEVLRTYLLNNHTTWQAEVNALPRSSPHPVLLALNIHQLHPCNSEFWDYNTGSRYGLRKTEGNPGNGWSRLVRHYHCLEQKALDTENWPSPPETMKGHTIHLEETDNFLLSTLHREWEKLNAKHTLLGRNKNCKKCVVHFWVPYLVDGFGCCNMTGVCVGLVTGLSSTWNGGKGKPNI